MEVDSLKQKIMAHCPDLKDNEIVVSDRLQHVINTGGHYAEKGFKWVGSFISSGVAKVGGFFGERVEPTGPTQKSEAAKTKFNELKEGTEKILSAGGKYISKVVEPVVAKGKEVVGSISTKIDNSSSDNVKYLKGIRLFKGRNRHNNSRSSETCTKWSGIGGHVGEYDRNKHNKVALVEEVRKQGGSTHR
jgi:hypothetical protein